MSRDPQASVTAHGTFAVLFFVCLAYVAVFRAKDTLALTNNQKRIKSYKRIYRALGLAMVFFPLAAALILGVTQADRVKDKRTIIFAAEFLSIYAFGAFWLVKSWEIWRTQKEQEQQPDAGVPGKLVCDRKSARVRVAPANLAV